MKNLPIHLFFVLLAHLTASGETGQPATTTLKKFNGFDDAPKIELLSNGTLPYVGSTKVSRADFSKVYPKDWAINVPNNYYRDGKFLASCVGVDCGAYKVFWANGDKDYYVGGYGRAILGLTAEHKGPAKSEQ